MPIKSSFLFIFFSLSMLFDCCLISVLGLYGWEFVFIFVGLLCLFVYLTVDFSHVCLEDFCLRNGSADGIRWRRFSGNTSFSDGDIARLALACVVVEFVAECLLDGFFVLRDAGFLAFLLAHRFLDHGFFGVKDFFLRLVLVGLFPDRIAVH